MPVGWGSAPLSSILSAYMGCYSGLIIMELRSRYFESVKESKANLIGILDSLFPPQGAGMKVIFGSAFPAV